MRRGRRRVSLMRSSLLSKRCHTLCCLSLRDCEFNAIYHPSFSSRFLLQSGSFEIFHPRRGINLAMVERGGENGVTVEDGAVPVGGVEDPRLQGISAAIRVVPHFPKPGIMFNDITTLLLRPKVFKDTIDLLIERYRGSGITVVAGIEARGFIFGSPLALALGAKFVPLRKPKKLPGPVISENYVLEYGTDCLEMHVGAVQSGDRALIIDDVVATGGTLCAAIRLLERAEAEVVECACIIGLPKFKCDKKEITLFSLYAKEIFAL